MSSLLALALLACLPALEAPVDDEIVEDRDALCPWYADADGDGFGDTSASVDDACAAPPDGYVEDATDCDDGDAAIHPDAQEICDGVDNNCDVSDDVPYVGAWHADTDGDGYGAGEAVPHCEDPGAGWTLTDEDCDDADPETYPGAPAECDERDRNCDGIEDGADSDGDGYLGCEECDDTRAEVNPGARETCDEEDLDEDCDGAADDLDPEGAENAEVWYVDADEDGFGDLDDPGAALCDPGDGLSVTPGDCDDGRDDVYPGAQEICDPEDTDEDCDGRADDDDDSADEAMMSWHYKDSDGDTYGDMSEPGIFACDPSGHYDAGDADDCNDMNVNVHPGAEEIWYDGVDSDCAGDDDYDADADGWRPAEGDCDDGDDDVNPDSEEVHANGIDEDCDGYDPTALGDLIEGDLVVTEMMINPEAVGDAEGEWFEIRNRSGLDIDLDGLLVHDGASGGNEFSVSAPTVLPADDLFVFIRTGDVDTNGGVEGDLNWEHGTFGFANDGEDQIVLSDATESVTFDMVVYDDTWEILAGVSLSLNGDALDSDSNDDADAWCRSVETFGDGDLGSPGEENMTCYGHEEDLQPLWDAACTSCHSAAAEDETDEGGDGDARASADLDLSIDTYETLLTWVNDGSDLPLVTPYAPDESYLWHKLSGTQVDVGGSGGVMPRGDTLPPEDRAMVNHWILQGARP